MYGYFDVDERTVIKLRRHINEGKMKSYREGKIDVEVGLLDENGYSTRGFIDWVDNVLDAGTGTLKIRAVIHQPKHSSSGEPLVLVSPGMFVRIKLPISPPYTATLISDKAIATDQGEKYIFTVNSEKKIERRNVKLGQLHGGLRVLANDLSAKNNPLADTDLVVISGLQRVRIGAEVFFTTEPMPRAGIAGK
jgi:multidrug efflux pump subunit AcrA (membrane-fusion protein)